MAGKNNIEIHLSAKDKVTATINKVKDSFEKLSPAITSSVAVGFAAWQTMEKAIAGVKKTLDITIGSAARQEEIMNRLKNAVNIAGESYEKSKSKIDDFLISMQATTKYGDTETAVVLQQIVSLTGDLEKGFEGTKLAADIAAAGLFDMNTAARYMAMAMEGNVEMLGRYIPELRTSYGLINSNMTAQEKWAIASDLMRKKFGGMAAGETDTLIGATVQFKNALGDLGEAMGEPFLKPLTNVIKKMTKGTTATANFVSAIDDLVEATNDFSATEPSGILNWLTEMDKRAKEVSTALSIMDFLMSGLKFLRGGKLPDWWEKFVKIVEDFSKMERPEPIPPPPKELYEEFFDNFTASMDEITKSDIYDRYMEMMRPGPDAIQEWVDTLDGIPETVKRTNFEFRNTNKELKLIDSQMATGSRELVWWRTHQQDINRQMAITRQLIAGPIASGLSSVLYEMVAIGKSTMTFEKFMRQVVAQIMAAVAQATILAAIMATIFPTGGGFGGFFKKFLGFQSGGLIPTGGTHFLFPEQRLVAAQGGEYIVSRRAVSNLGVGTLDYINRFGQLPQASANININIKVDNFIGEESWIKERIVPVIETAIDEGSSNISKSRKPTDVEY